MSKHDTAVFVAVVPAVLVLVIGCADAVHAATPAPWTAAETRAGRVVFQHHTLALIPSSHVPTREDVAKTIACELARGQHGSVQIGVHVLADGVENVRLEVESDLGVRVFRPIDAEASELISSGPAYAANPMHHWILGGCLDESNVIASVGRDVTGLFWIVLHAGPQTEAGTHRGRIRVTSARAGASGRPVTELDLEVRVRPFLLERARAAYFPFFYLNWSSPLPRFAQTDAWIGAFYRDMVEHSHNSVTFYGYNGPGIDLTRLPTPDNPYLSKLLPMGKEVGLFSHDVPCISFVTDLGPPESEGGTSAEQKNEVLASFDEERRRQGWPELISYGADEPAYPRPGLREYLKPFRDVRLRVGTAMGARAAYGHSDIHDVWIVYGGQITPEMAREAERLGAELWTYSCHLYPVQSIRSRYFAGLYMWVYGAKGHTTWHHYAQTGYKYVWVREGDPGPMPTIGWETRRDGIDDYRYLQMLEDCIAANPGRQEAAEAADWLASLRKRIIGVDPHRVNETHPIALDEYDRIRSRAADTIERLGVVAPAKTTGPEMPAGARGVSGLKDEAKAFRGRSVAACMQGLRNEDDRVRRAAAWALYELGPEASPATALLARQLADAETRMPALRALEAIGPEAYAAVEAITPLLSHEDAYVRLGATFALGEIGAPWVKKGERYEGPTLTAPQLERVVDLLRVALMDEFYVIPPVAGEALVRMGPAALPALPEVIALLDRPYAQWIWDTPVTVRRIIAAIGPQAGAAVAKLVKIVDEKKGDARDEMLTLAAIGPAARAAIPTIEKYAVEGSPQQAPACYALFCIRGSPDDLKNMVDRLKKDESGRAEMVRYFNALGAKATPVADEITQMLTLEEFAEHKEGLQSFLAKMERGGRPVTLMP